MIGPEIEIVDLPQAINLDDFRALEEESGVSLKLVDPKYIKAPDLLVLPNTKDSIRSMAYLRKNGRSAKIRSLAKGKTTILGICGGFEMMGTKIINIAGDEDGFSKCDGLAFFNIVTRLMPSEISYDVGFEPVDPALLNSENRLSDIPGFEVHTGRTKYLSGSRPFFKITRRGRTAVEVYDGAMTAQGNMFGSYIHGIFDNKPFRRAFIEFLYSKRFRKK